VEKTAARILERWPALLPDLKPPIFQASLEDARERWQTQAMPERMLHADLHWGNLKVTRDSFFLLDFDDCGTGPLPYDLATVAYATRLCVNHEGVSMLVHAYNQEATFPTTPEAVDLLTWARFLWLVDWILDRTELFPGRALATRTKANLKNLDCMARRLKLGR
jgi:Ser/Thr protein kinase RdoA (MazF antagonist)